MSPFARKINNALNGPAPPYARMLHAVLIPRAANNRDELQSGFLILAVAAAGAVFAMVALLPA